MTIRSIYLYSCIETYTGCARIIFSQVNAAHYGGVIVLESEWLGNGHVTYS